jgi:hypothetical protein
VVGLGTSHKAAVSADPEGYHSTLERQPTTAAGILIMKGESRVREQLKGCRPVRLSQLIARLSGRRLLSQNRLNSAATGSGSIQEGRLTITGVVSGVPFWPSRLFSGRPIPAAS